MQKTQLKPIFFQSEKVTEENSKVAEKNKDKLKNELAEEQCQPSFDIEAKQKQPTKASLKNARKKEARKAKKATKNIGVLSKIDLDIQVKEENKTQAPGIPTKASSETSGSMSQKYLDIDKNLEGFQAVTKPRNKRRPGAQPVAPAPSIIYASPIKTKDKGQKVPAKTNMVAIPLSFPQKKKEEPVQKFTVLSEQVIEWDLDAAIIESPSVLIPMSPLARDIKPNPVVKRVAATLAPVPVCMVASSKPRKLRDFGPPVKSAWKPIPKPLQIPAHSKAVEEAIAVSQDETTSMSSFHSDIEENIETGPEVAAIPEENEISTKSQEVRENESPCAIEEPASEHVQEQAETFSISRNLDHTEDITNNENSSVSESDLAEQVTDSRISQIIEEIEETQPFAKPQSTSSDEQSPNPSETPPTSISREEINNPFENASQAVDTSSMTTPEIEESYRAETSEEDQMKLLDAVTNALPAPTTEEELELAAASEDEEKELTVPLCDENQKKDDGLSPLQRKMLERDLNFDWSEEAEELAMNDMAVIGE